MESRIQQPCFLEKDKKKSRKRGRTECEPRDNLVRCSSSADEEKKKKKKKETIAEAPEPGHPRVLVRCSSMAVEEEKKSTPDDPLPSMGVVFNPSLTSWNQCPEPSEQLRSCYGSVNDYALIDTEDRSELCVFTSSLRRHTFNLTTAQWESTLYARVPIDHFRLAKDGHAVFSTSVAVGHLIFKFLNEKLYALDSSSPEQSFQPVPGLDNKLPKQKANVRGLMVYLGKGKLCIIWGGKPDPADKAPEETISITCLKFWVGMCNRRNRLRAVIDRCERFLVHGIRLHDVVAL
ncbi:hypothetical protein LguiA_026811 [Lonicera macranthoides]